VTHPPGRLPAVGHEQLLVVDDTVAQLGHALGFVDREVERLVGLPQDEFDREAAEVFGPDWLRHVFGEGGG
jgi:hypothetical protein